MDQKEEPVAPSGTPPEGQFGPGWRDKVWRWGLRALNALSLRLVSYPKGAFLIGVLVGILITILVILLYISRLIKPDPTITTPSLIIGAAILGSVLGFFINRILSIASSWVRSKLEKISRLRYAPDFLEFVLANRDYQRVAIMAGTLKWINEPAYQRAMRLLEPERRGGKEIYLFYKSGEEFKEQNPYEYSQTMERVSTFMREYVIMHVYHNPGRLAEIEGCLVDDTFALIVPSPFYLIERLLKAQSRIDKSYPFHDYVVLYKDKKLIKALWDLVNSYMALKLRAEDPLVEATLNQLRQGK